MKPMKIAVIILSVTFGLGIVSYGMIYVKGTFDAAREGQRTKVIEESLSYTRGMRTELGRLKVEYLSADTAGRIGIAAHIRDTYQSVDVSDYPEHLKIFLTEIGAL